MLRSKNLKRVLEQALTRDITTCAVFNADGVVLAYATAAPGPEAGNPGGQSRRASSVATDASQADNRLGATQPGAGDQPPDMFADAGGPAQHAHYAPYGAAGAGAGARQPDDWAESDQESAELPLAEIDGDELLQSTDARERLDDDLAIAASLWQSYENLHRLVGSRDRDAYDYTGDGGSEAEDSAAGNSLHMVIIECESGKAAVTKLGAYRLFLVSKPGVPLGMLRLKVESLCRFLEECLHCAPH
ncbi:hypothetical protein H4R18_002890 [Coemansia javaensis]|uniref:Roadblock/LAMTOR2 domain-containing protein n=1 Tax=Coemansia javaensis TaxID=2761396 RepID=A0A9W8HDH7_9FUNG|nr:hypothetical protein H4R18_002890 [Coemansia javaensis]